MSKFTSILKRLTLAASCTFPTLSIASAEPPVVKVGPDHYRVTWLEIGRTPMWLTDGCVAGYSIYRPAKTKDQVTVEDGCREGTPDGRLKTVNGVGTILDFGTTNAKMRVRYPLLITFNYWVLYKSPDKSWFISANPSRTDLWIYSRKVPSKTQLARMVDKARVLGYDVRKLEFPPQQASK
ncbi:lipocalin family protein [Rhizobium sp. XQZ8]|uniref:lipocalin family protein n=1 Tax=Rhizobium populisoli TaxID=2859785 RepID=UPI001CA4EC4D|nr:lipocalin family protein [Rhizobium populisoli]MBW6425354.1 lipocalin family protein [Rhizobium populisoli]